MPRLFHSTAALSAAAVLCLSPIAHGDEKGEALVRAAGERLTSAVPFFLSYKIVITKNGMIFEGSSSLMQVVGLRGGHGGGGSGPGISGAPGFLAWNLFPIPHCGGLVMMDLLAPVLSSSYAGQETVEGITYD